MVDIKTLLTEMKSLQQVHQQTQESIENRSVETSQTEMQRHRKRKIKTQDETFKNSGTIPTGKTYAQLEYQKENEAEKYLR